MSITNLNYLQPASPCFDVLIDFTVPGGMLAFLANYLLTDSLSHDVSLVELYSTGTVRYCVRYGTVPYGTVPYGTGTGTVLYGTLQYGTVPYTSVLHAYTAHLAKIGVLRLFRCFETV